MSDDSRDSPRNSGLAGGMVPYYFYRLGPLLGGLAAAVSAGFIVLTTIASLNGGSFRFPDWLADAVVGAASVGAGWLGIYGAVQAYRSQKLGERAETARQVATANPEKPQLAWQAAARQLETYLDRNLGQVRAIAITTYVVMFIGFAFILLGVGLAEANKLPVSIVAATSGVLVSFIGGSFMVVYRSLLLQSRDYLAVLERINGVGMAVAVIESIPDGQAELKHAATAELATTLLTLYGATAKR